MSVNNIKEKKSKDNNLKLILDTIKLAYRVDKFASLCTLAEAVLEPILMIISIYLSGYIIDAISQKSPLNEVVKITIITVIVMFVLNSIRSYLSSLQAVATRLSYDKFKSEQSKKTLTLDYNILNGIEFKKMREKMTRMEQVGAGFISVFMELGGFIKLIIKSVIAFIMLIPMLINNNSIFESKQFILALVVYLVIFITFTFAAKKYMSYRYSKAEDYFTTLKIPFLKYCCFSGGLGYEKGKDIRIYNAHKMINERIKKDTNHSKVVISANSSAHGTNSAIFDFADKFIHCGAYFCMIVAVVTGGLTIGNLVMYAGLLSMFIITVYNALMNYESAIYVCKRQKVVTNYLDYPNNMHKGKLPVEKRYFCDNGDNDYEIEFKDVSFKYPGSEQYSLKNISFRFRVGEKLAVVGMNGSGKTTMINLLCRLYDPTEGEIFLNGVNIKNYNYDDYMSIFGIVFQDFKLFSFTVGENIAVSDAYDKDKLTECIKQAGFLERFNRFEKGANTYLYNNYDDEGGVEISGGEAQKIALARALYKNAPFIILDEPTAALDPIAEHDIYTRFNDIVGDKTAIYISHRLSSCVFCDKIIVFDKGMLIQYGTHEELLEDKENKYYELWNAQAQYYTDEEKAALL